MRNWLDVGIEKAKASAMALLVFAQALLVASPLSVGQMAIGGGSIAVLTMAGCSVSAADLEGYATDAAHAGLSIATALLQAAPTAAKEIQAQSNAILAIVAQWKGGSFQNNLLSVIGALQIELAALDPGLAASLASVIGIAIVAIDAIFQAFGKPATASAVTGISYKDFYTKAVKGSIPQAKILFVKLSARQSVRIAFNQAVDAAKNPNLKHI